MEYPKNDTLPLWLNLIEALNTTKSLETLFEERVNDIVNNDTEKKPTVKNIHGVYKTLWKISLHTL
jgi:hypothetical protein